MALQFQRGSIAPLLRPRLGDMQQQQPQMGQIDLQQPIPQAQAPRKGGFDFNMLAGIIGDSLQTAAGGRGTYSAGQQLAQEREAEERKFQAQLAAQAQQREQARLAGREDFMWKQQNQKPAIQQQIEYLDSLPEAERAQAIAYLRELRPPQMVTGADGAYQITQGNGGGDEGLTPMTPEEIAAMGLPSGGPQQSAAGGFRP